MLIIGEGSQRETLEAQADGLGLLGEACEPDRCVGTRKARPGAKVLFTGLRDDVPAVTAALDVAVLPSYREAQGLAILEAMALRRPVVATRVGGVPEMIESGRTGLLVPPKDAAALADAIVRCSRTTLWPTWSPAPATTSCTPTSRSSTWSAPSRPSTKRAPPWSRTLRSNSNRRLRAQSRYSQRRVLAKCMQ